VIKPLIWFGGKGLLAHKLVPLLPQHWTYVEPFAGGASVLFAKPPSPVEVLNDVHGDLVNFYRVLRDPALFTEFKRLANLTPYSREEWEACGKGYASEPDPVRRAWMFFTFIRQGRAGIARVCRSAWMRSVEQSDGGMAGACHRWLAAVDGLPEAHARLRSVQIDRLDWRECVSRYDSPETLFYLDPPYLVGVCSKNRSGRYEHDMSEDDHEDLVTRLLAVKGKVLLSGYRNAIYERLESAGWHTKDFATVTNASPTRQPRVETVWANYPLTAQGSLF
jgi:DNA adenine methylase